MSSNFPHSSNRSDGNDGGGCIDGMLQCPICLRQLDDPRSLPCLHTYCRRCLAAQWPNRQPGDRLSCPVCRAVFDVPQSGLADLPHNFFLQQLIDDRRATSSSSKSQLQQQQQQHHQQRQQQKRVEFSGKRSSCDVCATSAAAASPTFGAENVSRPEGMAIIYCCDCRLKLCASCVRGHVERTDSGSHRLQSMTSTNAADAEVDAVPATATVANQVSDLEHCDKHPGRIVELYCFDCKANVCLMCFAMDHRFHDCQQLNQVIDSFRCRMETDEQTLLFRVVDFRKRQRRLETNRSRLVDGLLDTEDVIRRRADEMKRALDCQVKEIMRQIQGVRVASLRKFDSERKTIDKTVLSLELHCRQSKEVRARGKPCEVTAVADLLHAKAQQLLLTSHRSMVDEFQPPKVLFLPGSEQDHSDETTARADVGCNTSWLLGKLSVIEPCTREGEKTVGLQELATDEKLHYKKRPLALMSVKMDTGSGEVTGLTQLDDLVYVVTNKSSTINVLSASPPYNKLTAIDVDGLEDPSDIVACTLTKQLYIADNSVNSCCLWRIELAISVLDSNGSVCVENYSECLAVERRPSSLSITSGRLLITPHAGNRLFVHSTADGQLLKQVRLSYYMEPYHAVETGRGTYIVSHGGHYDASIGQVSEVDDKGRTLRTYGEGVAAAAATATGRLNLSPLVRLSLDQLGNRLLLHDAISCQVLLLDATTLQFQSVLITKPSLPTSLVDDGISSFDTTSLTSSTLQSTSAMTSRMYVVTESGMLFVSHGYQLDVYIVKRYKHTKTKRTSPTTPNTLQIGDLTIRCDNTSIAN